MSGIHRSHRSNAIISYYQYIHIKQRSRSEHSLVLFGITSKFNLTSTHGDSPSVNSVMLLTGHATVCGVYLASSMRSGPTRLQAREESISEHPIVLVNRFVRGKVLFKRLPSVSSMLIHKFRIRLPPFDSLNDSLHVSLRHVDAGVELIDDS